MKSIFVGLVLGVLSLPSSVVAATLRIESQSAGLLYIVKGYRSFEDSPLRPYSEGNNVFLEDFEDGSLDTPFVTITRGRIVTSDLGISGVRSVDGDDGVIDGLSSGGGVMIPNTPISSFYRFQFSPNILGEYPTFAGIVLTHESPSDIPADYISIGLTTNPIPGASDLLLPDLFAGSRIPGNVEHAVFLGFYNPEGITSVQPRLNWR